MSAVHFGNLSVEETNYINNIVDEGGNGHFDIRQKFRAHESRCNLNGTLLLYGYRFHTVPVAKVKMEHRFYPRFVL